MALPEKLLLTGQSIVMGPLLSNLQVAEARLKSAQDNYNDAIAVLEEYARQAAEKLGIDITKDYSFDLATKKFVDRSLTVQSSTLDVTAKS